MLEGRPGPPTAVPEQARLSGRVVFITQAYAPDETLLGVTRDWVGALAERCDGVDVIAQRSPGAPLRFGPEVPGIRVVSLGKDRGIGRLGQTSNLIRALAGPHRSARAIFVHMVPMYAVLAAPFARLGRVPLLLWYAHGTAGRALRVGAWLVDRVITPTRDSFPIHSQGIEARVIVTGHGIPAQTCPLPLLPSREADPIAGRVLSAGRLSPVKRHELAIRVVATTETATLDIAGGALHRSDVFYVNTLHQLVRQSEVTDRVHFLGDVRYDAMPETYRRAWVVAHASRTGSLDKVVLEACAAGVPVVSSAPSSRAVLDVVPGLAIADGDDDAFVARVRDVLAWTPDRRREAGDRLRAAVTAGHGLGRWADAVIEVIKSV